MRDTRKHTDRPQTQTHIFRQTETQIFRQIRSDRQTVITS